MFCGALAASGVCAIGRLILVFSLMAFIVLMPRTARAALAPSITRQPQNQTNLFGTNATFTVAASGSTPLFYQWSFNGTNLTNNAHLGGATNTILNLTNLVGGDTGNYRVVVTNSHGSATSSIATLTVLLQIGRAHV